jgi:heptosyltransferase-2
MNSSSIERLLIVSPNWLGDAIMALPALADVRRRFPTARLVVAARRAVASLFSMSPVVDEVIVLEWAGRLLARGPRRGDLARLRGVGADAALLFPNSFASAWLVRCAGIPERWGYAADLRRSLLTRAIPRPTVRRHQTEYYRHLVSALGIETGPLAWPLVVSDQAIAQARELLRSRGWDEARPLVVVAPGAAYGGAKRWPGGAFATTVTRLVREHQSHCALVGSSADAETTRSVRLLVPEDARAQVSDLAGATTLEILAAVMRLARACLSNDSGAMHLAGAVGVPLAALFGPTRERESRPLSSPGRRVEILINHVWCRPCMLRECPLDHRCMTGLLPERVFARVADLMVDPNSDPGSRVPPPESRIPNPEPRGPSPEP